MRAAAWRRRGAGSSGTCGFVLAWRILKLMILVHLSPRRESLAAEEAACRARASGALAATGRAGTHMSRTLVAAFVVIYAGVIGLAAVASRLIPH